MHIRTQLFTFKRIRTLFKVMGICDNWSIDPLDLHFEPSVRFARLAGSLTLKKTPSPDENALLAPARRPALHILWNIHIQGHLSSIHM
jgi:hypothetical protein